VDVARRGPSLRARVEVIRWTVVKHEAFALGRQRERHAPITDDGELGERPTPPGITHDQAERHERLHLGGEALALLKPREARALRLRAEGYSYKEICRITAWSYTKVNRGLTEGRRALSRRATAIEAARTASGSRRCSLRRSATSPRWTTAVNFVATSAAA